MSDSRINYDHSNSPGDTDYSHSTHYFNTYSSNAHNIGAMDERSEILAWLSPLEPRIRHQDIRARRADTVGEWLLQTDEFQRWYDGVGGEHVTLFCCGSPAVGKTYFSSLVVDMLDDKAKEENIAVACFYADFAAREEQSPTNILGSLLKQIVAGLDRIPDEINQIFQDHKKVIGESGLRVPEILKMLQTVTSLQRTFICVDAIDECVEGHRLEVLGSLRQIGEKSPNTHIFLTGRRHIRSEIERHIDGRVAILCIKPNSDDIEGYIRRRLSKDTSLDAVDSGLEAEIIRSIAEDIPETFLLIPQTMDAILRETTPYDRRKKLRAMTDGLDLGDVFGATLERIKEQGGNRSRLGMAALMWISHSERLLRVEELLHALAVEIGSTDLNPESIPSVETLLSCCLGLVVIDGETSTVRFVHFTLQEYLHTCPSLFSATHSIMAATCLTYLNFEAFKISPTLFVPPGSTAFITYSSLYWGVHARKETSRDVVSLALKLFGQIESHISTKLLLADLISKTGRHNGDIPIDGHLMGFSGLHCASAFGAVEIATILMGQRNYNLNKRDFLGITPLIWAAICGHEEVAKQLLERQATIPDKPDKYFRRTALSWAAGKGHGGIVRILLSRASAKPDGTDGWWGKTPRAVNIVLGKRYVNPNRPDKYGQTPVLLAAEGGHEGVVKQLLERKDVRPDVADGYGRTAFSCALREGHEGVVKLLLEQADVGIDRTESNSETALLWAARAGYEGVVDLLLRRKDINPNTPGEAGQTPLSQAARHGHDRAVKLLLGREDVNPDMPDNLGRTPLSRAAAHGYEGAVKLLLGREDVNPDMPDNLDRTPLARAAEEGHNGVVKLLLGQEDVNPDIPDNYGRTPLARAAEEGHNGVVKLLLGREDVSPDMPDNYGRTPLARAAEEGHDGVVKLLLGREDVNPNMPGAFGRVPLSWAAEYGHDGVVKLLLGREDVNPDMPDNLDRTPLSWATKNGHDGVVKLLLGRGDVNPNLLNEDGLTPLSWAAGKGHDGIVKLLLGREDVNPGMLDYQGQTPLLWAAICGHDGVVKLLLGREDVNPDMPDNQGQTPLSWAAICGHDGVVKLLLGREDVNPDMPDNYGRTPLAGAAEEGHNGVVKLLLGREDVNPDMPDNYGRTPLSRAAAHGYEGAVKLLLGREDVSPDMPDNYGRTPLTRAAEEGHNGVVKLLLGREDVNPDIPDNYGRTRSPGLPRKGMTEQ